MQRPINQSARSRAWDDTKASFHQLRFFWGVEVGSVSFFIYLGTVLTPEDASKLLAAAYPAIGGIIGAVVGFGIIFAIKLFWTPYKQRDEARAALRAIPGATSDTLKIPSPPELAILHKKHELDFGSGVPIITVYAEYRSTNVVGKMRVESVELELLGERLSCLDGEVFEVSQDLWFIVDNKFKLPDGIGLGEHDVKLVAFANGEWWGSQPFAITVPEVNS